MTDQNNPAEKATKMKREPGGRNNALTHGGFSQDLIWEDENSEDFEELLQSVIKEFSPTGALEEDTVLTLAQSIWLKRRAERFYVREATWAQEHPGDEVIAYADTRASHLDRAETFEDAAVIISTLPEQYRRWIEQECPRSQFNDAEKWIQILKKYIQIKSLALDSSIMDEHESLSFQAKKAALVRDLIAKKILLDERLDARIDKAIKRLAQLKTFKQIIEASASQKNNEQRRISNHQQ
jgi:hypothetical protein